MKTYFAFTGKDAVRESFAIERKDRYGSVLFFNPSQSDYHRQLVEAIYKK